MTLGQSPEEVSSTSWLHHTPLQLTQSVVDYTSVHTVLTDLLSYCHNSLLSLTGGVAVLTVLTWQRGE